MATQRSWAKTSPLPVLTGIEALLEEAESRSAAEYGVDFRNPELFDDAFAAIEALSKRFEELEGGADE